MKRVLLYLVYLVLGSWAAGGVFFRLADPDTLLPLTTNEVFLGRPISILIYSDANEPWQGGLFLRGQDRLHGRLVGRGTEPVLRHYPDSCFADAGPQARAMLWKDSSLYGFDFYTEPLDPNAGDWFVVDYQALRPGSCTLEFFDYSPGDPNSWSIPAQTLVLENIPSRDFNEDGLVNLEDFAHLAAWWFEEGCSDPDWCAQTDFDRDGFVGLGDLALFSEHWLRGMPGWQPPLPPSAGFEYKVFYRLTDAEDANEITLTVGESVRLYIQKTTVEQDINLIYLEAVLSDTQLGWIDNTEYDPNNPQASTAELLAEPRYTFFDYWGPGETQPEGIVFFAVSLGEPIEDGAVASFLYTASEPGNVLLELIDSSYVPSRRYSILIHQVDPMQSDGSGEQMYQSASIPPDSQSAQVPEMAIEEAVEFLETIWEENPDIREQISEEQWNDFVEKVRNSSL